MRRNSIESYIEEIERLKEQRSNLVQQIFQLGRQIESSTVNPFELISSLCDRYAQLTNAIEHLERNPPAPAGLPSSSKRQN